MGRSGVSGVSRVLGVSGDGQIKLIYSPNPPELGYKRENDFNFYFLVSIFLLFYPDQPRSTLNMD
ncbi:MAG: hypothetical protein F6J94_22830 [Moorea sp. SIO1F2]|uniref:hypothetical protein n=1 Tax=Moorena sp. SIO1F2 TaxID=2607819 RepID=UPI0013BBF723|nr:hypothetical protein [Moorena sp. SIO1F2]NET84647.1 hypothetical protein [Moorena sp. SIO1F2]